MHTFEVLSVFGIETWKKMKLLEMFGFGWHMASIGTLAVEVHFKLLPLNTKVIQFQSHALYERINQYQWPKGK